MLFSSNNVKKKYSHILTINILLQPSSERIKFPRFRHKKKWKDTISKNTTEKPSFLFHITKINSEITIGTIYQALTKALLQKTTQV